MIKLIDLGRFGDDAILLAGGTELLLLLKLGFGSNGHLVDVRGIPELSGIRSAGDAVEIGAAATHREIERSEIVRERIPALAEMEHSVANVRVRTMGTLGGNLCFGDPHSDPATFLLAAGAEAVVRRGGGAARTLPVEAFLCGPYQNALEEGDLLTCIRVQQTGNGTGIAHGKLVFRERPTATVAVWVRAPEGRIEEARIAVGSVGPVAVRARAAESLLTGGASVEDDSDASAEACGSVDDANGSAEYKRALVRVLVSRTLPIAMRRARSAPYE